MHACALRAAQFKQLEASRRYPEMRTVFVRPHELEAIEERLKERGTDTMEQITASIHRAQVRHIVERCCVVDAASGLAVGCVAELACLLCTTSNTADLAAVQEEVAYAKTAQFGRMVVNAVVESAFADLKDALVEW